MTNLELAHTVLYEVALRDAWHMARIACLQMAVQIGSGPLGDLRTAQVNGLVELANNFLFGLEEITKQLKERNEKRWKNPDLLRMLAIHIAELQQIALDTVISAERASSPIASPLSERNARLTEMHLELVRYYLNTAVNFSLAERSRGGKL